MYAYDQSEFDLALAAAKLFADPVGAEGKGGSHHYVVCITLGWIPRIMP